MNAPLYIIASCANRKRNDVPRQLRLRSCQEDTLEARARAWCKRLETCEGEMVPAVDLYAGDYWAVVKTLKTAAKVARLDAQLWVASAGYGLVSTSAHIQAYSATFAKADKDSVARRGEDSPRLNQKWWDLLGEWSGPDAGAPRSVSALIRKTPNAGVLVVGSPDYILALQNDLLKAAAFLKHRNRFVIVSSADGVAGGPLGKHLVASDAVLQKRLGGARVSLHARVARMLLELAAVDRWELGRLRTGYEAIRSASPKLVTTIRMRMTDEEVRQFIRRGPRPDATTVTTLLRSLRASGRACEQARFKKLVADVRRVAHGA